MSIRDDITDSIVRLIETGAARGSSSPLWDAAVSLGLPVNYATRQPYSGVNVPLLWGAAQERGFECNEWLTFKQALALGAIVRKGAKGVLCAFYKLMPRGEGSDGETDARPVPQSTGTDGKAFVPMLKPFWLFNVADVQGLGAGSPSAMPFDPIERAEALITRLGVPITWSGTRAFYRPASDEIFMPSRERFSSTVSAYAVALHECVHASGHPSRLAREFGIRFGDDAYAFEELVAELGSAFLVAHLGLPGARLEHHASYIESWLRVLRSQPNAVFTASRHANAAFQFIVGGSSVDDAVDSRSIAA